MSFSKEELTIGEMSALFKMDTQTLRYYDSLGLFSPQLRDETTRIRRYPFEQAYQLAAIRFLRQMDCPIKQVQKYIQSEDAQMSIELLQEQSDILRQRWQQMQRVQHALDLKVRFVQEELAMMENSPEITVREYPARRCISIGPEDLLYKDELFYLTPTAVLHQGKHRWYAAYIIDEQSIVTTSLQANHEDYTLPAGRYLCSYHCGSYTSTWQTVEKMRANPQGHRLADKSVYINIVDMFLQKDANRFISAVQIPIEE